MKWNNTEPEVDGPPILFQINCGKRIETQAGYCIGYGDIVTMEFAWTGWQRKDVCRWIYLDEVLRNIKPGGRRKRKPVDLTKRYFVGGYVYDGHETGTVTKVLKTKVYVNMNGIINRYDAAHSRFLLTPREHNFEKVVEIKISK